MIDEFQDTSRLQWNNFYPLFYNAVSQQNRSLVVGDVKQAIYRWRNGDWTLLNSELTQQFKIFGGNEKTLPENWRSAPEVVNFNNEIFKNIPSIAASYIISDNLIQKHDNLLPTTLLNNQINVIKEIYSTAHQNVPEKNKNKKGFVEINFFKDKNTDKEEIKKQRLNKMIKVLEQLFDKGFQPRNIAVLVRKGSEGAVVAKKLMEYIKQNPLKSNLFKFVSNDSVLLGASSAVLLLTALLKFLINDNDLESKAEILFFYNLLSNDTGNSNDSAKNLSHTNLKNTKTFFKILPDEFVKNADSLKKQPLSSIVNNLLSIFIFKNKNYTNIEKQLPFIHTFQDFVLNYVKNNGNDIFGFLQWWNEQGYNTPVSLSENQNAIKIITVHKSKGLEYSAVIIPFADWKLDHEPFMANYIWCHTDKPFDNFSAVPVKYSSSLVNTKFQTDYFTERAMAFIDNINLLYVAVTRAEKALFIFTSLPENNAIDKISDVLYTAINNNNLKEINLSDDDSVFRCGELIENNNKILPETVEQKIDTVNINTRNLRLRLSAKELFTDGNKKRTQSLNRGKVFHKIMENIITVDDIIPVLNTAKNSGIISVKDALLLETDLTKILNTTKIYPWFSDKYSVLTETTILTSDGEMKRPDRVMENDNKIIVVDYKFTSNQKKEHIKQVKEYIDKIKLIETKPVEGFVWYVLQNNLVKIN
jgi:ATP-dependent exoDNAse (exonuclease V) beta subunit